MELSPKSKPITVADRFRFPAVQNGSRKRAMTTNQFVPIASTRSTVRRESSYEDNCIFHCHPITSLAEETEVEIKFNEDSTRREALFRAVDALALVEKPVASETVTSTVDDVRQLRSAVDTAWSALYHAHPRRARAATVSTGRTIKRKSVPLPDIDGWTQEAVRKAEADSPAFMLLDNAASKIVADESSKQSPPQGSALFGDLRELEYCQVTEEITPDRRTVDSHSWLTSLGVGREESGSNLSIAELLGVHVSASSTTSDRSKGSDSSSSSPDRSPKRRSVNLFTRLRRNRQSRIIDSIELGADGTTSEEIESDIEDTPVLDESASLSSSPSVASPPLQASAADSFFGMQPINNDSELSNYGYDRAVQSPVRQAKALAPDHRWRTIPNYAKTTTPVNSLNLLGIQSGGRDSKRYSGNFF
jgi:hypothetical protein